MGRTNNLCQLKSLIIASFALAICTLCVCASAAHASRSATNGEHRAIVGAVKHSSAIGYSDDSYDVKQHSHFKRWALRESPNPLAWPAQSSCPRGRGNSLPQCYWFRKVGPDRAWAKGHKYAWLVDSRQRPCRPQHRQ